MILGISDLIAALVVGVPIGLVVGVIVGLYLRLISDWKAWFSAVVLAVAAIVIVTTAAFTAMYILLIPVLGVEGAAFISVMPFFALLLKNSDGRTLFQSLVDPIMKPIEKRLYIAAWPEGYDENGNRKQR